MSKWKLTEEKFNVKNIANYESLMYQGNGYMGIRNSFEEKYVYSQRAAVINGVFNTPEGEVPEIVVLPDVTNFDINIDGYLGLVVSSFVIISSISMIKETLKPLIGILPTKEQVDEIINKILSYEHVQGIHDLGEYSI